ncbi:carbohydrate ABC transporter permease [uncultured Sphaerochaeta sp.]|uniref:carbohydrate ABC transporter permease n=1 Tax=uncultured Sphaerochaeta sp. TaxID=886478 RepID=UPI002A0A382C|nr:carbohydrate ABC transporter permease [uncultured Sphaerochaeta sp.]
MKHNKKVYRFGIYALLVILLCISCLPIISMIGTSIKTSDDVLRKATLFPGLRNVYLLNYPKVWKNTAFPLNILNSSYVSVVSSLFCVILASLAGYALSRFHSWIFTSFIALLLILQMMPLILILIPTFSIYKMFGLTDTLFGLIINYASGSLAFAVLMLKSFFDTIPQDIEEAATIDGCTQFQGFLKVILPISTPGLSTVVIFVFVRAWNEYMVARILLQSERLKTVNLGLQVFSQQFTVDWGLLSAASVIATIPTILFLVFAQKYLVQGMTAGAVKG